MIDLKKIKEQRFPANFVKIKVVKNNTSIVKLIAVKKLQSNEVRVLNCFHNVSRMFEI